MGRLPALLLVAVLSLPARALIFGEPCGERLPLVVAVVIDVTSINEGAPRRLVAAHCTGLVVAPDVVLTAAHCVDARPVVADEDVVALSFSVSFQDDLRGLTALPVDAVAADDVFVLPGYSFEQSSLARGIDNDLQDAALLFFSAPLTAVDADFAFVDDVGLDRAGLALVTAGYGATDPAFIDATRGQRTCGDAFFAAVSAFEQQVGAGTGSLRGCNGDSGGPLLATVDGDVVVTGLHSHALNEEGCDAPSVSVRLAPLFPALDAAARAACDDGIRSACDPPGLPTRPPLITDAGFEADAGLDDAGPDAGTGDRDAGFDDDDDPSRPGCSGCAPALMLVAVPLSRRRRRAA